MLKTIVDFIAEGYFSPGDRDLFRPLIDKLRYEDSVMVLADYQSDLGNQDRVDKIYRVPEQWSRRSILNTARMENFLRLVRFKPTFRCFERPKNN